MKEGCARIDRIVGKSLFKGFSGLAVAWCLLIGLWIHPANGYVLDGPHVLALMGDTMSGIKTLRVDQQVVVEDLTISEEPVSLTETLRFIFPGKFRSDTVHEDSRRIHVVSHNRMLTIVDNKITEGPEARYDQYKDLLLYNSIRTLQKILYRHGVDVGTTSLGRLGDQVVFVIGAIYPDESVSQVWVDKEQFVPLRWLNVRRDGVPPSVDDRWEFLYSHWQKVDSAYYPFKIETYHNGQRIRQIRVTKADANAVINGELFNIAHLQSIYQMQEAPPPGGSRPPSELDEVQKTIEEFKKKFEP